MLAFVDLSTFPSTQNQSRTRITVGLLYTVRFLLAYIMGVDWDTVAGKSAHVGVFGILAWLIWRVYPNLQVVLWGTMLYGFLDEFHQLFIPGRTGRLLDVMFDCLGAILAVWWLRRREG